MREMLLNEFSEQADLFSVEEKSELIFHLFKTLAVGGALCQPDSNIDRYTSSNTYIAIIVELQKQTFQCRYLDITKDLYKELVTLYRYTSKLYTKSLFPASLNLTLCVLL